jgi:hypothetical protein
MGKSKIIAMLRFRARLQGSYGLRQKAEYQSVKRHAITFVDAITSISTCPI